MALPISSISLSNTFGQWIITTQNIVTELNSLDDNIKNGSLTKNSGTFFINSSGIGLSVSNAATFGSIQVSNTSIFNGNVTFNKPVVVNTTSSLISGVELKENLITFSTTAPRGNTYISINRGSGYSNAQIRWFEGSKKWQIRNIDSPSLYDDIITSNTLSSTVAAGIVQLNNNYNNTSITQAATINSVNNVYITLTNSISNSANITNIAYSQANTARSTANAAYSQANTARSTANSAISKLSGGTSGFATPLNGQLLLSSNNGMIITGSANTININTPQDLRTTAEPTFSTLTANTYSLDVEENAFSPGILSLASNGPIISMLDRTGISGSCWLIVFENTFYITANSQPNATFWNIEALKYYINTDSWDFSGNVSIGRTLTTSSIGGTSYIPSSATYNISNNEKVFLGEGANNSTINLPSSPNPGNFVTIGVGNYRYTTINRNTKNIMGKPENLIIDVANSSVTLVYSGNTTLGWKII